MIKKLHDISAYLRQNQFKIFKLRAFWTICGLNPCPRSTPLLDYLCSKNINNILSNF
jgi:hypothetical protein